MPVVVALVLIAVAVAIAAGIAFALKGASSGDLVVPDDSVDARPRPPVGGFHVHGDTATVSYDVPLPPGEVDEHLSGLLLHDAVRVVREKSAAGLPIDQVERVRANGRRDGEYVEAGVLELREPGVVPELAVPDHVPHTAAAGYDPLAYIGEQEFEIQSGIGTRTAEEGLEPFHADLALARGLEASLRASGIDPTDTGLEDLTLGLLATGGYTVVPVAAGKGNVRHYLARGNGEETLVGVLPHHVGEHPELSEQVVSEFGVTVAERNPTRAMLITDKFGPYSIYERERRNPKCRFITRERLQAFADGFALQ